MRIAARVQALRGLDGSMDYAVDQMNAERTTIFACFAVGVLATLGARRRRRRRRPASPPHASVVCAGCLFAAAWVLMETEVAIVASVIILSTMYLVVSEVRVQIDPVLRQRSHARRRLHSPRPAPPQARRIRARFFVDPKDVVDFTELASLYPKTLAPDADGARSRGAGGRWPEHELMN